jgi:tetratricopeptide (TPR) repeat protein
MKLLFLLLLFLFPITCIAGGFPPSKDRVSNCENQWFLKSTKDTEVQLLGFAYMDPSAGFTFEHNGDVGLNENGEIIRLPNELKDKARLIIRVSSDFKAACLSDEQATKLGLSIIPSWLKVYKDKREPGPHNISWAYFYNHIGASHKALDYLKEAEMRNYKPRQYYFELGYALNASGDFQGALKELQVAVKEHPADTEIIAELGYAYWKVREFDKAIEFYELALKTDKKGASQRRWEFAHNISAAYSMLGNTEQSESWKVKSDKWKPKQ